MPLLIDGHNLIGRLPDLDLADVNDEVELVRRLRVYCHRHRRKATLVFDAGLPGGRDLWLSAPPVEVVFASPGSSADAVVRERIRRARDPRGLLVVSSDRSLQRAAQARGARVVPAEEFAAALAAPLPAARPEKPDSPTSVDEWLTLFEAER